MNATHSPVLFLSHGSPMWAIEPGESGPALARWAHTLPGAPKGIVIMSPHWMSRGIAVMTNPRPPTWHDFGGFPEALYRLRYPAPGAPALGEQVLALLQKAGLPAQEDPDRPLDHGAWVPLMHLFPQADVPVVQVSLPVGAGPAEVYAMGRTLASLRDEGVLVIGSGSMTHNLREFFNGMPEQDAHAERYVSEFARWVEDAIQRGDREALLDYRARAPHAVRAHPTDEHFLTLFFALGAAGWGEGAVTPEYLSREIMYRYLAMDAVALN